MSSRQDGYNRRRLCIRYSCTCMHSCFQAKHEPSIVLPYKCLTCHIDMEYNSFNSNHKYSYLNKQ